MRLNFSPVRKDTDILINVEGDSIWIDGVIYDFSPLNEGDTLPSEAITGDHFAGNITRADGEIVVTIALPHGANAPYERRFPEPVVIDVGTVELPPYDIIEQTTDEVIE